MSEIQDIVEAWIEDNMGHMESEWEEAGGDTGGFQDILDEIKYDVTTDVECDLEGMVQDNLANHRQWEIEDMIRGHIDMIEPEEVEEVE